MNRPIKFRGQREDTKEWAIGYLIEWKVVYGKEQKELKHVSVVMSNGELDIGMVEVIPETVGQFTGLPSQDKQDIYEGDRLFDYDDDYYIVEFSEGRFVAVGDGFEVDLIEIANRCSVIGNIHEND